MFFSDVEGRRRYERRLIDDDFLLRARRKSEFFLLLRRQRDDDRVVDAHLFDGRVGVGLLLVDDVVLAQKRKLLDRLHAARNERRSGRVDVDFDFALSRK